MLPPLEACAPEADCVGLLQRVIEQVGAENFPQPIRLDDAAWVVYRIAEMLPIPMAEKQLLLEFMRAADLSERIINSIKTVI